MAANTSGSLLLGGGATGNLKNPFVGTCVLSGIIPAGWTVEVTPFSALSASAGSGNAGTLEYNTDDSTFLDPGTFTNSGTFIDVSTGFSQQIAVADFVNTGVVVANGPGLSFGAAPTSQPAVPSATFLDRGSVRAARGGVFSSGGAAHTTFVLPFGGAIEAVGVFNIANYSTFDMDGGSVTVGVLRTSQFLGAAPPTFNFAAHSPAGSSGTIDDTNGGTLHGIIPKHWSFELTGGSLTATPGSGNAGVFTLDYSGYPFLDRGAFTNSGAFVDAEPVAVRDIVNQAHALILVKDHISFAASGSVSNAGQVALAAGASMSVGGAYTQGATGVLQITVAGTTPATYGRLAVIGRASLSGVLRIARGPGYAAKVGDTQQILTAARIVTPFRLVRAVAAGPGLVFKAAYSGTALTLTVGG